MSYLERGEYIGPTFKVPKEATVTIPYKDFEAMKSEIQWLRKKIIELANEKERQEARDRRHNG